MKEEKDIFAQYEEMFGEPLTGVKMTDRFTYYWEGKCTDELRELFKQYEEMFHMLPDGYESVSYSSMSYEEFVANIKECLRTHIDMELIVLDEEHRAFFLDHDCPLYKRTIDCPLCCETLDFFRGYERGSMPKELEAMGDIEAARKICDGCRFSIYDGWLPNRN